MGLFGRKRETQQIKVVTAGNVEFVALEPRQLKPVAVVAQALDNQWVPQHLLDTMVRRGQGLADVASEREQAVRNEYVRSLVNAEQTVINRAFLYNNSIVARDYTAPGQQREAFKSLLAQGIIVPYLYAEESPDQPGGFSSDEHARQAWGLVCQEVRAQCVRLAWDPQENAARNKAMARTFDQWVRAAVAGDKDQFAHDLGLRGERIPAFTERLKGVAHLAADYSDPLTREMLYKAFVVREGSAPADGYYANEHEKPFAKEIKQLLDLRYNTNLPDMLDRYALTPVESLPRSALQELRNTNDDQHSEVSPDELMKLFRRLTFDMIQGGLYLKSMGELSLEDVLQVRDTNAWRQYTNSLQGLLRDPLQFQGRAQEVYRDYAALAGEMTKRVQRIRGDAAVARWMPAINLVILVGGAVLSAVWAPPALGLGKVVLWNMSQAVGQDRAGVAARLIIRGAAGLGAQADLRTSIDFMRRKSRDAETLWKDMRRMLEKQRGFKEVAAEDLRALLDDANINMPEETAA